MRITDYEQETRASAGLSLTFLDMFQSCIGQVKVVYDVINVMVQYDGDLDIEIDEEG